MKTGQGHRSRIDRIYCTPDLAPALRRLEVMDSDEVRTASDHALIVADFSRSALHMALTPTA